MDRYARAVAVLCFNLLALILLRSCMATTFADHTIYTTSRGVRTAIPPAIRTAISQLNPGAIYGPDFSHSYTTNAAGFRIRVTITYCTLCMDRNNIPQVPILGQDLINRCNTIFTDMLNQYNRPYRNTAAFRPTSIRGVNQGVRIQYVANRVRDELRMISYRPSPDFISPPPVTDLPTVQVIDNGLLRLHGQRRPANRVQPDEPPLDVDYAAEDCPIDASYLVSNDDINGEELATNQYLESAGHSYRLVMQDDCNLVLYDNNKNVTFATGTNGLGESCFTLMQTDCNLVVYDNKHKPLWASNTDFGITDQLDCVLSVEDNGLITIWATGCSPDYQSCSTLPAWVNGDRI